MIRPVFSKILLFMEDHFKPFEDDFRLGFYERENTN